MSDGNGMPQFTRYPWQQEFGGMGNVSDLLASCVRQVQQRTGW